MEAWAAWAHILPQLSLRSVRRMRHCLYLKTSSPPVMCGECIGWEGG